MSEEQGRIYDSTKRYVLAELEDGYAIWDVNDPGEDPLATFPGTAEGFLDAEARFNELKKADPERRDVVFKALRWVVIIGTLAWAGIETLVAITYFGITPISGGAYVQRIYDLQALADMARGVWIAAAAILAILWVERFWGERSKR